MQTVIAFADLLPGGPWASPGDRISTALRRAKPVLIVAGTVVTLALVRASVKNLLTRSASFRGLPPSTRT